jgi:ATP-dependent Lon protease
LCAEVFKTAAYFTYAFPRPNKKDLEEIPKELRRDLDVILVDRLTEVLQRAFV